MTHAEAVAELNALERQHDVHGLVWRGVHVWPVFRMAIGEHLLSDHLSRSLPVLQEHGPWGKLKTLLRGSLQRAALSMRTDRALLYFSTHNNERTRSAGKERNRFVHPLLAERTTIDAPPFVVEHLKGLPSAFPELPSRNRCDASDMLQAAAYLHWRKPLPRLTDIPHAADLLGAVKAKHSAFDPRAVADRLHNFEFYRAFHQRLLGLVEPTFAFAISWYNVENMALAHACHERGTLFVDMQHGVQGPAHLAYGKWACMPRNGWTIMPSIFWCWDGPSASNINKWTGSTRHRALVLGHPWLRTAEPRHAPSIWANDGRMRALFTLQPLARPLPNGLPETIARTSDTVQWIIRAHPNRVDMLADVEAELERCGVRHLVTFDAARDTPLPSVLAGCDVHVTQYSSVVLEASYVGIPSIATHPSATALYADGLAAGTLIMAENAEALCTALADLETTRDQRAPAPQHNAPLATLLASVRQAQ